MHGTHPIAFHHQQHQSHRHIRVLYPTLPSRLASLPAGGVCTSRTYVRGQSLSCSWWIWVLIPSSSSSSSSSSSPSSFSNIMKSANIIVGVRVLVQHISCACFFDCMHVRGDRSISFHHLQQQQEQSHRHTRAHLPYPTPASLHAGGLYPLHVYIGSRANPSGYYGPGVYRGRHFIFERRFLFFTTTWCQACISPE